MKQATLNLEPPAATTRPTRVTTKPATETACAAAPAVDGVDASYGVGASGANLRTRKLESSAAPTCADAVTPADDPPTKAPAGPRSKAARIIELAKALGVQSDAEAKADLPF